MRHKYIGKFPSAEDLSPVLLTEQGAEITPLELLRRMKAGEPLSGVIYDDYDDTEDYYDPLNRPGVEIEDYQTIRDISQAITEEVKEKRKASLKKPNETPAVDSVPESTPSEQIPATNSVNE